MSSSTRPGAPMDFLTSCSTSSTLNPILEEIHERSAEVVLAIFRLVKIAMIHSLNNDAVKATIESSHQVLQSFIESVGRPALVTYAQETVFVCGELLRASSTVYQSAIELGALLAKCGASEVRLTSGLTEHDLLVFAEAISTSLRDPEKRGLLLEANIENINVRAVDALLVKREDEQDLSIKERTLRAYASAILVVRQFYEAIASGATMLPHRVKRVAQRLVILAEEAESSMLGMTTLTHAQRDDTVRAVHSSILALIIARQLTRDRVALSRFAMAALLADAGRAHVVSSDGVGRLVRLTDDDESRVPAHAGAIAFVTGGINFSSAERAVAAFETTWLERQELLGPLYDGDLEPLLQSQVLRLARALIDLVAPRDITEALTPFEAVAAIAELPWVDVSMVRLVINAVGALPIGTVVELDDGSWGVVTERSDADDTSLMPKVRLLTDERGATQVEATFVDLGTVADQSGRTPTIVRAISPDRTRFNVTRAFLD